MCQNLLFGLMTPCCFSGCCPESTGCLRSRYPWSLEHQPLPVLMFPDLSISGVEAYYFLILINLAAGVSRIPPRGLVSCWGRCSWQSALRSWLARFALKSRSSVVFLGPFLFWTACFRTFAVALGRPVSSQDLGVSSLEIRGFWACSICIVSWWRRR